MGAHHIYGYIHAIIFRMREDKMSFLNEAVRFIGWSSGSQRASHDKLNDSTTGGPVTYHTARWSAERGVLAHRATADTLRSLV